MPTDTEITELVGNMVVGEVVAGSFHTLRKDASATRELLKLAGKRFAETPSDVKGQLTTLFYNVREPNYSTLSNTSHKGLGT